MHSPIKVVLLLLAAVAQHVSVTPPNPPPSKNDEVIKGTLLEKSPRVIGFITKHSVIACLVIEAAVLLSLHFQSSQYPYTPRILSAFCPSGASPTNLHTLSHSFLIGICIMFSATAMRISCYKALGSLFTFEITIKPGHRLITTGPYAYVRHPGYTASVSMIIGTMFTCLGVHSYISECHIMSTPARWIVHGWVALMIFLMVSLLRRGKIEDEELRKTFGERWEEYSRSVPCRFIPGLV